MKRRSAVFVFGLLVACGKAGHVSGAATSKGCPTAAPGSVDAEMSAQLSRGPLPAANHIESADVSMFSSPAKMPLADVRGALTNASIVDPCAVASWSYAPMASGTFRTGDGEWKLSLFYGGRGQVTDPAGARTMFDAPAK